MRPNLTWLDTKTVSRENISDKKIIEGNIFSGADHRQGSGRLEVSEGEQDDGLEDQREGRGL